MKDRRLTPITCRVCGKPATYEFLYKDERMCVMCYMTAATGQSVAAIAHADPDMICEGCGRRSLQSVVYKKKTLCGVCYVKAFEAPRRRNVRASAPLTTVPVYTS
jgi:hypothetical protein